MMLFCWQRCLVIACYVTARAQAARQLPRMTKWLVFQTASQERDHVGLGQHQPGRRGGKKRDAVEHGGWAGSETSPWPSARCALQPAAAWPRRQEGSLWDSRFSLMPVLTVYTIYYELPTRGDGTCCLSLAVSLL